MSKLALMLGLTIMAGLPTASTGASAADMAIPPAAKAREADSCGPCGCLQVTWEYHRVMESTYGTGFDPRNFDTTQPHFYLGRVKAYPNYWCDGYQLPN